MVLNYRYVTVPPEIRRAQIICFCIKWAHVIWIQNLCPIFHRFPASPLAGRLLSSFITFVSQYVKLLLSSLCCLQTRSLIWWSRASLRSVCRVPNTSHLRRHSLSTLCARAVSVPMSECPLKSQSMGSWPDSPWSLPVPRSTEDLGQGLPLSVST